MAWKKEFTDVLLKEFDACDEASLRIRLMKSEEGKEFLDIRRYFNSEKYTGWGKGIRIDKDTLIDLVNTLEEVESYWAAKRLAKISLPDEGIRG